MDLRHVGVVIVGIVLVSCVSEAADQGSPTTTAASTTSTSETTTTTVLAPSTTTTTTTTTTLDAHAPPQWLGTRPLALRPDGFGEVLPTPPELIDRAFSTPPLLPPPSADMFLIDIGPIPPDVLARSTWSPDCPVSLEELAYITLSHWGFDGQVHTGELIVNAAHADGIASVFAQLHQARFPIEEMRVIRSDELDAPPTGDGNVTTSFVCRPAVGSTGWSMHSYGLAIDINPFHNPYLKGDLVLPELASHYLDRDRGLPGMIVEGDIAVTAFDEIGWFWGGRWNSLFDWMHFSVNNR
jgi:hypothetical protein